MLDFKPTDPEVAFQDTIEFYKKAFIEVISIIDWTLIFPFIRMFVCVFLPTDLIGFVMALQ